MAGVDDGAKDVEGDAADARVADDAGAAVGVSDDVADRAIADDATADGIEVGAEPFVTDGIDVDHALTLLGTARRAEAFEALESVGSHALDHVLGAVRGGHALPADVHPRDFLDDLVDAITVVARADPSAFLRALDDEPTLADRFVVVAALGRLDPPHGAAHLQRALASRDGSIRWLALEAIVRRRDPGLAAHLVARLRDRDSLVRFVAARALREHGTAAALPELERFLAGASLGARDAALDAMEAICARENLPLPASHPGERLVTIAAELPVELGGPGRPVWRVTEAEQVREGRALVELHDDDGLVGEVPSPCDAVVVSIEGATIVLRRTVRAP